MKPSTTCRTRGYASVAATVVVLAAVFGPMLIPSMALAQPSPPEVSEQPAEAATEPDAGPPQADDGQRAGDRSEGQREEDNAAPVDVGKSDNMEKAAPEETDEAATGNPEKAVESDRQETTEDPSSSKQETETAKEADAPRQEPSTAATDLKKLTVATWSGAYGEAQRDVVIDGFKAKQSVAVRVIQRDGEEKIDLTAEGSDSLPDAAEFSGREIDAGCKAGQLVKLSEGGNGYVVSPAISDDFLPGSLKPCGIGAFAWSHVIAVNPNAFKRKQPQTLAHVFDTKAFPGKRAFLKQPRFLMEMALMADGAEPYEVYGLLGSDDGLQRAFAKLDSIRGDILWFDTAKSAMTAIADGKAVLAQSFSGRAFFEAARGTPVDIIWDGQIYAMTYWAIPAKSPRRSLARTFLEYATEPQQLAAVAQRFPYGPTRISALALTKRHLVAGVDLGGYLPTAPDNMKTALSIDETWWATHDDALKRAFSEWLARPVTLPGKKE